MDAHLECPRRYELLDAQGDTYATARTLLEAVQDCPEDGAILDTFTREYVEFVDVAATAQGRAA